MKLLVASDGSKNSVRAVQYAIDLAGKLSSPSTITLISVHDDTALRHAKRFVGQQAVEEYLHEESEADLAESRQLLDAAKIQHDSIIRTGQIATEIVKAAHEGRYEMILMGSKGRGGIQDLLIGSVARRVIELSRTPVLLVR